MAGNTANRRRAVIVFFEGYLPVAPTVVGCASALADRGVPVVVYYRPSSFGPPPSMGPSVSTVKIRAGGIWARVVRPALRRALSPPSMAAVEVIRFGLRVMLRELTASMAGRAPGVIVGVDDTGAVGASLAARVTRRPWIFLSLELKRDPRRATGPARITASIARTAFRKSIAVIVQAQDRFEILSAFYGWEHPRHYFLPNAPRSAVTEAEADPTPFRQQLELGESDRIALQAGMINDTTCSASLAKGFSQVSGWKLVLHEREERDPEHAYLRELRSTNPKNLVLSLTPVPYERVGDVFAAATVGLVFYAPGQEDLNFRAISSSGKLPRCLQAARPVLVSALPALSAVVEQYGCGIAIEDPGDPAELQRALDTIMSDYARFSENARTCFNEAFSFDHHFRPIGELVSELCDE